MKVALVHDWFNTKNGGAERVALKLADMFPSAPVFTLIYNSEKFGHFLEPRRVKTSYLQKLPQYIKQHPRYLLPLIPSAISSLKIEGFDVIISSSSAFAKNIHVPIGTTHICYCHSPMRFAYDYKDRYLGEQSIGSIQKYPATVLRERIRSWDQRGSSGVDTWVANSRTVAARIKKYYGQEALIINPPVAVSKVSQRSSLSRQDYFVTASALSPYKQIDRVIDAANREGFQLKIIGEGSALQSLRDMAGPTVQFCGFVSEEQKNQLIAKAQALIYPNEEDFGIAMVEALALGTPVIALNRGGAQEILTAKTGVLIANSQPETIITAIHSLKTRTFLTSELKKRAAFFNSQKFETQIRKLVKEKSLL